MDYDYMESVLSSTPLSLATYHSNDPLVLDSVLNLIKHNHNLKPIMFLDEGKMTEKIEVIMPANDVPLLGKILADFIPTLAKRIKRRNSILDLMKSESYAHDGIIGRNDSYYFGTLNSEFFINIKIPYDGFSDIIIDELLSRIYREIDLCEIWKRKISREKLDKLRKMAEKIRELSFMKV